MIEIFFRTVRNLLEDMRASKIFLRTVKNFGGNEGKIFWGMHERNLFEDSVKYLGNDLIFLRSWGGGAKSFPHAGSQKYFVTVLKRILFVSQNIFHCHIKDFAYPQKKFQIVFKKILLVPQFTFHCLNKISHCPQKDFPHSPKYFSQYLKKFHFFLKKHISLSVQKDFSLSSKKNCCPQKDFSCLRPGWQGLGQDSEHH